ncbi:MAG: potassium transporter TrkG [Mucinivorans sp.]
MIYRNIRKWLLWLIETVLFILSLSVPFLVVYEFGFPVQGWQQENIHTAYSHILVILWVVSTLKLIFKKWDTAEHSSIYRTIFYVVFTTVSLLILSLEYGILQDDSFIGFLTGRWSIITLLLTVSFGELSRGITSMLGRRTNPAVLLASSFAFIIFLGSLLLQLPEATVNGISYIDSLFVSSSAVCVTGLTPIDCSTTLTTTGYVILLMLIQVGGLGIMTITSFFGLFFMNSSSFAGQIVVSDLLSSKNMGSLMRTLLKIIIITLSVEALGALFIYLSIIDSGTIMSNSEVLFFAIFHAISAFCNAGFSTLQGNLADHAIRNINGVMWVVSWLIIFGGIGFPIFSNLLHVAMHKIRNFFRELFHLRKIVRARLWSLNTYIVLRTTGVLLLLSWGAMLALEWNNTLAQYDIPGKLSQGFLMAVTPRTAGFNGVDISQMLPGSILLTMILMWIGGAPQSTAGGIKVTTFYLTLRNIFTTGSPIEVHRREIPDSSVRRALGVITASLAIIFIATLTLTMLEPTMDILSLAFEVISAIGTVGLTVGITPHLSEASKIVIILLMFIGRIGIVGLFALFIRRNKGIKSYSYPQENILIN